MPGYKNKDPTVSDTALKEQTFIASKQGMMVYSFFEYQHQMNIGNEIPIKKTLKGV